MSGPTRSSYAPSSPAWVRIVAAECAKLWTLPAARAALLGTPVVTWALVGVLSTLTPSPMAPLALVDAALTYTQAGVVLLGALVMGHEHAGRQLQTSLLAVPDRRLLLAAKALVALVWVSSCAAASVLGGLAVALATVAEPSSALSTTSPSHTWALLQGAIVAGLLSHAAAALTRSSAAAAAAVLALTLIVSPLLSAVTPLAQWLPDQAARRPLGRDTDGLDGQFAAVAWGWLLLTNLGAGWIAARAKTS